VRWISGVRWTGADSGGSTPRSGTRQLGCSISSNRSRIR